MLKCRTGVLIVASILGVSPITTLADSLYESKTHFPVTFSAPITTIVLAKNDEERPSFDGTFTYTDPNGGEITLDIGVRARGNFRRQFCRFIPLQLNFKKSQVKDTYMLDQNKLKLVSTCRPGKQGENWLLLEYLSYEAWAVVSDYHFRARMLDVAYVDTSKDDKVRQSLAFVIEDDGDTAKRLGGTLTKESRGRSSLDEYHAAMYELFQFFIGNNDYSLAKSGPGRPCCHNSRIIDMGEPDVGLIPIPYDFDHSGMVDAKYARPPDNLVNEIDSVRKRYFTGVCKSSPDVWLTALEQFKSNRAALRAVYDDERLDNRFRRNAIKYVDQFFEIADDPKKVQRFILDRCRGSVPQGKS